MEPAPLHQLIQEQGLPEAYAGYLERWFRPLTHQLRAKKTHQPYILGVQGCQGSGKSTLAMFLCEIAKQEYAFNAVSISLDDFYLTHEERQVLAETTHPLLATRGVPGTHDIDLAVDTLNSLKNSDQGSTSTPVPRFNKATDDRLPKNEWDAVQGPVDLIILEGWCVGCGPQTSEALYKPANDLEAFEDSHGTWRRYANQALADDYPKLFNLLDGLAVLKAPSFECVLEWRWLQEQKLVEKLQKEKPELPTRVLNKEGVKRFISHYERLTRHCLETLPQTADWVLTLNEEHEITDMQSRA